MNDDRAKPGACVRDEPAMTCKLELIAAIAEGRDIREDVEPNLSWDLFQHKSWSQLES